MVFSCIQYFQKISGNIKFPENLQIFNASFTMQHSSNCYEWVGLKALCDMALTAAIDRDVSLRVVTCLGDEDLLSSSREMYISCWSSKSLSFSSSLDAVFTAGWCDEVTFVVTAPCRWLDVLSQVTVEGRRGNDRSRVLTLNWWADLDLLTNSVPANIQIWLTCP